MASGVTPINGIPTPVIGDAFNPAVDIAGIGNGYDTLVIPRFATTSARTGAFASTTLAQGMYADVAGVGLTRYNGTSWLAVSSVPWTTPAVSSGWGTVATGVRQLQYRKVNGRVEFAGMMYYSGTIAANGGVALTAALSDLAGTSTGSGTYMRIPIGVIAGASVLPAMLNVASTGALYVNALNGNAITNGVVTFEGAGYADTSVG